MFFVVFLCATLAILLRATVHSLILRGLRAPRLAHQRIPEDLALQALSIRLPVSAKKPCSPGLFPFLAHPSLPRYC